MVERNVVVAFVPDAIVSHTAWRVTRPLAALDKVGVPTQVVELPGPSLDGWVYSPTYESVTFDAEVSTLLLHRAIVPVQYRESFTAWIGQVRASGVTVVFDTDDDCYSPAWAEHMVATQLGVTIREGVELAATEENRRALGVFAQIRCQSSDAAWIISQVDGITVSTAHLAGVVKRFTDKLITVAPNAIDVEAFRVGLTAGGPPGARPWLDVDGAVTIGWCAGSRPAADFEPVGEAWARIASRYPSVRFVMAGAPLPWPRIDPRLILQVPYTDMASYPWGMQVDIGCCSASDTPFNRSRSPIKAWEFALAGAVVVASPTVYASTGANLAETADEWEAVLSLFIDNPKGYRQAKAAELRERVETEHDLNGSLWRWQDAWRAIRKVSQGVTA